MNNPETLETLDIKEAGQKQQNTHNEDEQHGPH
jgi:hypothetical protein